MPFALSRKRRPKKPKPSSAAAAESGQRDLNKVIRALTELKTARERYRDVYAKWTSVDAELRSLVSEVQALEAAALAAMEEESR